MNILNYVIPGAFILYLLANRATNSILARLNFKFVGIQPDIINLRIKLKISMVNPLPTPIVLDTITGNLLVNNSTIADFFKVDKTILTPGPNEILLNTQLLNSSILNLVRAGTFNNASINFRIVSGPLSYSGNTLLI